MKKFKITKGNRVYIVDAKSHIDAISKVKAVKTDEVRDSISQWKPGMSEIGLFQISYKKGTVNQSILVKAATKEDAINKFTKHKPDAEVISVSEYPNPHFGEPILDSKIKDDSYYYLLRDAIDLLTKPGAARGWSQPYLEEVQEYMIQKGINPTNVNQWKKKYESLTKDSSIKDDGGTYYGTLTIDLNSPDDLTASKIVQELKNEIGNNKIAEIRGGTFTPVREYGSASLELDFKEFKKGDWGTNHIRLAVSYTVPAMEKALKNDPKYGAYKLRTELNNKLKQFANKTIYTNRSFTMDSSIKDEWSGIRSNGVIFNYSDGKYTITHKNGKVETFPGNKFNTAEELFKYIDNIKDSKIKDIDEYKKNYAASMRAAGEKTKRDQINSDIQKLYDIAKQYGPIRTEQNKLNNEFRHQNMQVVRNRFYNDPTVKRALKQMEDLDKKWDAIIHKYPKLVYEFSIDDEGPNRFMGFMTPTKKWVDDIKKQLIKDSAIKDEDYSKYLSIVKQLEKLVEPTNRALQQKIAKYGVTKQDIRNNSPKYRDVCREIPELKVWAKLIMQLPGELAGFMPAHPSQESVDKLKKAITNSKAFDSTIK